MFILVQCAIVLGSGFLKLSPNHKNHRHILFFVLKTLKVTSVLMQNSEKSLYHFGDNSYIQTEFTHAILAGELVKSWMG